MYNYRHRQHDHLQWVEKTWYWFTHPSCAALQAPGNSEIACLGRGSSYTAVWASIVGLTTVHRYVGVGLRVARTASVADGDGLESRLAAAADVVVVDAGDPVVAVALVGQ
jgi:hypothetical protein